MKDGMKASGTKVGHVSLKKRRLRVSSLMKDENEDAGGPCRGIENGKMWIEMSPGRR